MSYGAAMTVAERIRQRLKDAMQDRSISQRELADLLSDLTGEPWTQSRVQKVLTGYVELKIEDVDCIARACGISLCEAVRDPGMEFYAEMTPTELRVFQRLQRKPEMLDAIMVLLNLPRPASEPKTALVLPAKPKRGRPLNSSRKDERPVPSQDGKSGQEDTKALHHRHRPK